MKKHSLPVFALAAMLLASCGASSGGSPIVSSSQPQESSASSAVTSQATSEGSPLASSVDPDATTLPALHLVFYEKFADQTAADSFKSSFENYLASKKVVITSLTINVLSTGGVADFCADIESFETSSNYVFDAILGAKANLTSYVTDRFSVYKDGDDFVEYSMGEKTDRRLWTRNETDNDEALFHLINYVRVLSGRSEESEQSSSQPDQSSSASEQSTSDETSSQEQISSIIESSDTTESSESIASSASQQGQETVLPALHLVFYKRFAAQTVADSFVEGFENYLSSKNVTITTLTVDVMTEGNVASFVSDVSNFEASSSYTFDALLGVKANFDDTYLSDNFAEYKNGENTMEYPLGEKTDRRLWTRKETQNGDAVNYLIKHVRVLAGLPEEAE